MNTKAYEKLNYTLALIATSVDGKRQGCIANSLHQVTSSMPAIFSLALNKSNETCKALQKSGSFVATVLGKDVPKELINQFGYKSGRIGDKFTAYEAKADEAGNPYLTDHMVSRISGKVINQVEVGNYILFLAQVTEAEVLADGDAMTVTDFLRIGKATPPAATVYRTLETNSGWVCPLCGFVYEGDVMPEGYVCPICRCEGSKFVKR